MTGRRVEDAAIAVLPRWASWIDALSVLGAVAALAAALSPARVRLDLGFQVLSLERPWRPLVLAIVLSALRHWQVPRPHLGERVAAWSRRLRSPAAVLSARLLLTSRLTVLAGGYAATLIIGLPQVPDSHISMDPLRNLPARWDARWYEHIAREGYRYDPRLGPDRQQPIVFFPAYPMLMRTVAAFTIPERGPAMTYEQYLEIRQVHLVWAGVAISLLAFFCALIVVYRWAEMHAGADAAAATVLLLSAYPFAVYYSAPYTESLFLLLAAGACYAFERGRLTIAAVSGLLAGLTRPNGAMLSLVLAILALTALRRAQPGWIRTTAARLIVAAMPGIGMLLYSLFIYRLTGDPFAWIEAQAAWGRTPEATANHYAWIARTIENDGLHAYIRALPAEVIQIAAVAFTLALVWPVWRRVGPAYAVLMLANVLPPLWQGGVLSLGRFTATLFPQFLALTLMLSPERRVGWLIAFAIGQGFVAAMFFTWRPIY